MRITHVLWRGKPDPERQFRSRLAPLRRIVTQYCEPVLPSSLRNAPPNSKQSHTQWHLTLAQAIRHTAPIPFGETS